MTLDTETYRLGDELERLDERQDELAERLVDATDDEAAALEQIAESVEQQGRGVAWLVEQHGPDTTVTVRGLTSSGYALVEDRVDSIRQLRDDDSRTPGAHRNVYAAAGLNDAPFLDREDPPGVDDGREFADLDAEERFEATYQAVTSLPIGPTKWLYSRVDEATTVDPGNWTSFGERLRAKRRD